jgi:phage-related protein
MGIAGRAGFAPRAGAIPQKLEGTDGLWEVRAEFGGDAFRPLGFWEAGRLIILTNGFVKKTQKTPERELALAGQRRRDYLNRRKQP